MSETSILGVTHAVARAVVRAGACKYVATRYDDGAVSVFTLVLRDGFDGTGDHHWAKPTNEQGVNVAHSSRATWSESTHVLVPAGADGPEDDHVPFDELVPPAVAMALRTGLSGRSRGTWRGEVAETVE